MPYFKTAQEWLDQSKLLLEARPSTTRITTRYSIKPVKPRKTEGDNDAATSTASATPKPPRGSLVFKTYDPESGVALKYRTTKAAEVSRLIYSSLGSLGRGLAAVPEPPADEVMPDAPPAAADAGGTADKGAAGPAAGPTQSQAQQGSGGKKKKKGKK